MYKRQIAYFDLIEYGEKKGSGGFCKCEQKNGVHRLELSITGLKQKYDGIVKIYTKNKNELGEVKIRNGCASVTLVLDESTENLKWEFSQIRIPLEDACELMAEFETGTKEKKQTESEVVAMENVLTEAVRDTEGKILEELKTDTGEKVSEEIKADTGEKVSEKIKADTGEKISEESTLLYSLWDCLTKTHEVVRPFGTEAEYCKIELEDILLLKEKYHILRKNQFLFHGYYNYRYLIVGRKEENTEQYWLGVPGIYHEREKMAARMYGFEKFEGAKPRYEVGDLGYYLITVE